MTEDMSSLIQRIEQLEARINALKQPKTRRKRATQASSGNINLDDNADLFVTIPTQPTTAAHRREDKEEITPGMLVAEQPFGFLD